MSKNMYWGKHDVFAERLTSNYYFWFIPVHEFQKQSEEYERIDNMVDNDLRDPRLPAPLEPVNVDEEELEKWKESFKNKLFP